jgi:hypothetical protein
MVSELQVVCVRLRRGRASAPDSLLLSVGLPDIPAGDHLQRKLLL